MTAEELRELQERVELAEQIVETPGWMMMVDRARVTLLMKQQRIVQGQCKDHEDYVKECSFIEGLDFFMKLPARMRLELDMQIAELEAQMADVEQDESYAP